MDSVEAFRAAKKAAHWEARQRTQLEKRGDAGVAEAWWDRVRAVCKASAAKGDPEPWWDLARTLENWMQRHSGGHGA